MRITHSQMATTLMDNLYQLQQRKHQAQIDLSSGVRIHKPSDDPTGTSKAMGLRHQMDELEFYRASMNDASEWLKAADSAMTQLTSILHRAREITISGANADKPEDARYALAAELDELIAQAVSVLNTQHNGRYVFGGTGYHVAPITYDPSLASPFQWQGHDETLTRIVGQGERFQINFTADQFSTDGSPVGMLKLLQGISADLRAGNGARLGQQRLQQVQAELSQVLNLQSEAGAKLNRIEQNFMRMTGLSLHLETLLADTQGTDMARTMIDLSIVQAAHETALAIGARIIPRTLLDFLR